MKKSDKISKEELIKRAKEQGFFKKDSVQKMYARSNGHFYYSKPPSFLDGHETHEITREDVGEKVGSGSQEIEYPMNQKETVKLIKECDSAEALKALVDDKKLLDGDTRKGVIKALEEEKEQLSQ
ncbi:MAG: hypothetical protein QQN55_01055 [Nitrosopumilus sp.]